MTDFIYNHAGLRGLRGVSDAVQQYDDDLPSSEFVPEEMILWRAHYMAMDPNNRPESCSRAIQECDTKVYPKLHVLLQIRLYSVSHKV
jgi:hypothetical protein